LGWKSLGLLELTALPSVKKEIWVPMLQETDALLVGGGDCQYLCYWMQHAGLRRALAFAEYGTRMVGQAGYDHDSALEAHVYHTVQATALKLWLSGSALHPIAQILTVAASHQQGISLL